MTLDDARAFMAFCEISKPEVRDWKFKADNQMGFLLLKDAKLYKYEVHVHYAANGNRVLTGANVRWEGQLASDSIAVETTSRLVKLCDEYLHEATNSNFTRDAGTKDI
jgi:hypothetical protein